jgi:hypothetical protein
MFGEMGIAGLRAFVTVKQRNEILSYEHDFSHSISKNPCFYQIEIQYCFRA